MSTHRARLEKRLTRRQMLRQTTLAGVGVWTFTYSRGAETTTSPNEKLNLAGIGVGGYRQDHVRPNGRDPEYRCRRSPRAL